MVSNRGIILTLALMLVLAGSASIGTAQETKKPSLTVTSGTINVDIGETSTVSATYRFKVSSVGTGENKLSAISGEIWRFSGRSVDDFTASVNGNDVSPNLEQKPGHIVVSVPVSDVQSGDTITVSVNYAVSGPAGKAKVPLWVPNYQTTGNNRVIDMTVTLPEGNVARGDMMPKPDQVTNNGQTLKYNQLHVPGFVSVNYGTSAPLLTLSQIMSIVGILIVIGFLGSWWRFNSRATAG